MGEVKRSRDVPPQDGKEWAAAVVGALVGMALIAFVLWKMGVFAFLAS